MRDLDGADLKNAYLIDANFTRANLKNADLRGTQDLSVEQIQAAYNWTQAGVRSLLLYPTPVYL